MTEIFVPPGKDPIWPASIYHQVFLDEHPKTMFSDAMTPEEKAEFSLYQVLPTEPPTPDPAENRLSGPVPALVNGQWIETWELVPLSDEEKAAYQQQVNPPNWEKFEQLAVNDPSFNQLFVLAQQPEYEAATAATRLLILMSEVRKEGEPRIENLRALWEIICRKINPPRSEVERFAAVARLCRLPKYFIDAIRNPVLPEKE